MAEADILKVSILGKDSIHCGFHLIPYIAKTVISTLPSSTYILITDNNIAKLHLKAFEEGFQAALQDQKISGTQPRFLTSVIPPGETSKSRESKAQIENFLLLNKCTRDAVVLALGGGVIGDLVGFVAATLYASSFFKQFIRQLRPFLACVAFASSRFLLHFWLWLTLASGAKQPSIPHMERT